MGVQLHDRILVCRCDLQNCSKVKSKLFKSNFSPLLPEAPLMLEFHLNFYVALNRRQDSNETTQLKRHTEYSDICRIHQTKASAGASPPQDVFLTSAGFYDQTCNQNTQILILER